MGCVNKLFCMVIHTSYYNITFMCYVCYSSTAVSVNRGKKSYFCVTSTHACLFLTLIMVYIYIPVKHTRGGVRLHVTCTL